MSGTLGVQIKTGLYLIETFTGDGSTVNFTLKRAPGSIGALDIVVAGVPQTTSYSVNGTTLTFDAAPANGAAIWVRHLGEQIQIGQPSANTVGADQMANGRLAPSYAKLTDTKTAGTAGGSSVASAWTTHTLNTEDADSDNIVTLSSNQFVLQAGTYKISGWTTTYQSNVSHAKIYNVTDAADALVGSVAFSHPTNGNSNVLNHFSGEITIAAAKTFELQYYCAAAKASNGLGTTTAQGVSEIFAQVEIEKVK